MYHKRTCTQPALEYCHQLPISFINLPSMFKTYKKENKLGRHHEIESELKTFSIQS